MDFYLTFKRIAHDCKYSGNFSDRTQNIGKACVATAHFTNVFFAACNNFCNYNSRIHTAQKVSDNGGN